MALWRKQSRVSVEPASLVAPNRNKFNQNDHKFQVNSLLYVLELINFVVLGKEQDKEQPTYSFIHSGDFKTLLSPPVMDFLLREGYRNDLWTEFNQQWTQLNREIIHNQKGRNVPYKHFWEGQLGEALYKWSNTIQYLSRFWYNESIFWSWTKFRIHVLTVLSQNLCLWCTIFHTERGWCN